MPNPPTRTPSLPAAAPHAIAAAILADVLILDHEPGFGLAVLAAAMGLLLIAFRRPHQRAAAAAALAASAGLPLAENVSLLSFAVALALLSGAAVLCAGGLSGPFFAEARRLFSLALLMPVHGVIRLAGLAGAGLKWRGRHGGRIVPWIMPAIAALVFVALFAAANPLIERLLAALDLRILFDLLSPARILFWIAVGGMALALLVPPVLDPGAGGPTRQADEADMPDLAARLFGPAAILRALALFNLVFLVQNLSDLAVLWTGTFGLPDGMTHAEYAHRGAYPLMATAALAGLFALVALRPGSAAAASRPIRRLNALWIGQNLVLTAAAMHRLVLYVDAYGLTHWRIAALLWEGLVAVGLALIVMRITKARSGAWLARANLLTGSAVLYAACFIDFSALIAEHNLALARRTGLAPDIVHIASLGPSAIPAIERHLLAGAGQPGGSDLAILLRIRDHKAARLAATRHDWRSDSLRLARIAAKMDGDGPLCGLPLYRFISACAGGKGT